MSGPSSAKSALSLATGAALLTAFVLASPGAAHADIEDGRIIAERWCASCHLVGPGQEMASDQVATFLEIARDNELDAQRLRLFLEMPHPPMPDLQLTHREIRSLIAYIESLAP